VRKRLLLSGCGVATPYALLLFGGGRKVDHRAGCVAVDGWVELAMPAKTAVLLRELRRELDGILGEMISGRWTARAADVVETVAGLMRKEETRAVFGE